MEAVVVPEPSSARCFAAYIHDIPAGVIKRIHMSSRTYRDDRFLLYDVARITTTDDENKSKRQSCSYPALIMSDCDSSMLPNEGLLSAFPAAVKNITKSYEQRCPNSTYCLGILIRCPHGVHTWFHLCPRRRASTESRVSLCPIHYKLCFR